MNLKCFLCGNTILDYMYEVNVKHKSYEQIVEDTVCVGGCCAKNKQCAINSVNMIFDDRKVINSECTIYNTKKGKNG